jgi:hypothetical protein
MIMGIFEQKTMNSAALEDTLKPQSSFVLPKVETQSQIEVVH